MLVVVLETVVRKGRRGREEEGRGGEGTYGEGGEGEVSGNHHSTIT